MCVIRVWRWEERESAMEGLFRGLANGAASSHDTPAAAKGERSCQKSFFCVMSSVLMKENSMVMRVNIKQQIELRSQLLHTVK